MLAAYLASMVESIGDYHSCAKISEAPPPTERMISKGGIGSEGLGCLVAGILQSGSGTTSYSENIGAMGITRVASRRVIRCGAIIMLVIPILGKIGALFASLPGPVVGAMYVGPNKLGGYWNCWRYIGNDPSDNSYYGNGCFSTCCNNP